MKLDVKIIESVDCSNCLARRKKLEIRISHQEIASMTNLYGKIKRNIPGCCSRLIDYFERRKSQVISNLEEHMRYPNRIKPPYRLIVDVYEFTPFSKDFQSNIEKYHNYSSIDLQHARRFCQRKDLIVENLNDKCGISFYEVYNESIVYNNEPDESENYYIPTTLPQTSINPIKPPETIHTKIPETIDLSGTPLGDYIHESHWMKNRLNKWARERGWDSYSDYLTDSH